MSEYPSLPEQGKHLAKTIFDVFNHIRNNGGEGLLISEEVATERIKICHLCEEFDAMQNRCKNCGCFLPPKVKFVTEKCPLGKWPEETDKAIDMIQTVLNEMQNESESEAKGE
jgi:hypothetical protein